jgi:D-3-phosphoglycerate dehydrogenase
MARILANDGIDEKSKSKLEKIGHTVNVEKINQEQLIDAGLQDFDCIIVRSATTLDGKILEANTGGDSKLRLVIRAGVGLDNIDIKSAESLGLTIRNTPNASTNAVVELTIAHLISNSRSFIGANLDMREGKWTKKNLVGTELSGKNLGLIGFGRIAKGVARIAQALGMKVHAYDPFVIDQQSNPSDVTFHDTIESLFSSCSHISVHCAMTSETKGMVNSGLVRRMPDISPNGVQCGRHIVNCSRGGIVNEDDMLELLESGFLASLGIDVFENEPYANPKLSAHRSVSSTPHIGAATIEAQERIGEEIVSIVSSFFN